MAWNEPRAAKSLGQHFPSEHLMYVLEIDPPLDKGSADGITMMPACSKDGTCNFNVVRKISRLDSNMNGIET